AHFTPACTAATGALSLHDALPIYDRLTAVVRGRRTDCVVGDQVSFRRLNRDQAVIESVLPRKNQVARSDSFRTKVIAANVDQARSEEHTSELQSRENLVCRLLREK